MARQIRMTISEQGRQFKRQIIVSIICLALLVVGLFAWALFLPKESQAEDQVFIIEKGLSLADITQGLKQEGLIKSAAFFQFWALFQGEQKNLMAGSYRLSQSMSAAQILDKLGQGEVIRENLTVIEGWTLADIAKAIEEKELFPAEDFLAAASPLASAENFSDNFPFLKEKPNEAPLEGYLFPDTYQIEFNQTIDGIIRVMLANFEKKVNPGIKEKIKSQNKTLFQVLTMASLLEKEVKTFEDKQVVAGILWKRLAYGWPLQVDATVSYLTSKASLELTKDDLAMDSKYNTYKYYGLPLGPICNPGLESIKAAIDYKKTSYWYYLTDKEGRTIFNSTLDEHNSAKRKYLK